MKILLATDGSSGAHMAVDFTERFPFPRPRKVTVVNVITQADFKGKEEKLLSKKQRKLLREARHMVQEESNKLLAIKAKRFRKAGWSVKTEIRDGLPAEEIVNAAQEHGVDLIVMGCHGVSGKNQIFVGRISDTVMEHAHCPVLIVKKPGAQSEADACGTIEHPLHVLSTYDGSDAAGKAISFCASLPFENSDEITVLSVLPLTGLLYRQDIRQRLSGIWLEKKKNVFKALKRVTQEAHWSTQIVSTQLRESRNVCQTILNAASELEADLLVLSNPGGREREISPLESSMTRIVHQSPCSVLAVR